MFYFAKIGVQNNIFKEKAKNFEDINNKSKTSNLVNLFIFFCNQRRFLNKKVVNFFFHVVFLSVKKSAFKKQQMCLEEKKSILSYKVSVFFLRFVYFAITFSNNVFKKNSEIFFSEKKNLTQFLLYYKSVYYTIFLNENYKNSCLLAQFNFKLYSNYLVYSIFYFLRLYIQNLQDLELKEKNKIPDFFLPTNFHINSGQTFYEHKVFVNDLVRNKTIIPEKNMYLSALCSSQINSKTLDDGQLSILLNNIRSIYRFKDQKKNSLLILNKLIKQVIPLSKIIYQRRGRSLIPLMTFVYSSDIRNSLGLKHILKESNKIQGFGLNSYDNKLLIYLLDILISKQKNDLIYQFEHNSDTRKEAYNRGYFFKTLKAQSKIV